MLENIRPIDEVETLLTEAETINAKIPAQHKDVIHPLNKIVFMIPLLLAATFLYQLIIEAYPDKQFYPSLALGALMLWGAVNFFGLLIIRNAYSKQLSRDEISLINLKRLIENKLETFYSNNGAMSDEERKYAQHFKNTARFYMIENRRYRLGFIKKTP